VYVGNPIKMPWELFRSQPMTRCQIMMPPEAAFYCVMELGDIGLVEFIDVSEHVAKLSRNTCPY